MQEKENNILQFPAELAGLVHKAEEEVIQSIIDSEKYKKYKYLIASRFKGKLGNYILNVELDNVEFRITFNFD